MRRRTGLAIAAVMLAVTVSGCLDPYRPMVDDDILAASELAWVVTEAAAESGGVFGPNVVETEYRYTPADGEIDTPGLLLVIGIRTASEIATSDLLERAREILDDALAAENVIVDDVELMGTRVTQQGSPTQWFALTGHAESDAPLFGGEEEVKVLGEAWYDGRSKTHVVAIALVQTTTTGFLGAEDRDHTVWNQIVGDEDGTVGGATNEKGFIIHVHSHN